MGGGDPCNMLSIVVNFYKLEHNDAFRQVLASIIAPIPKVDPVGSIAARSMFGCTMTQFRMISKYLCFLNGGYPVFASNDDMR